MVTVRVEVFGDRWRASVSDGAGLAGPPFSVVVREGATEAVLVALEQAAHDVAHELTRTRTEVRQ